MCNQHSILVFHVIFVVWRLNMTKKDNKIIRSCQLKIDPCSLRQIMGHCVGLVWAKKNCPFWSKWKFIGHFRRNFGDISRPGVAQSCPKKALCLFIILMRMSSWIAVKSKYKTRWRQKQKVFTFPSKILIYLEYLQSFSSKGSSVLAELSKWLIIQNLLIAQYQLNISLL